MKKNRDKYEVGHGKPPVHSRYQKGQSGNPKGRPRKLKIMAMFEDAVKAALMDEMTINGETVPKFQAIAVALVNDAIRGKGNARAILMPTIVNMKFHDDPSDDMTPNEEDRKMLEEYVLSRERGNGDKAL